LCFEETLRSVIAGLDPAIHLFFSKKVDARIKSAHDEG
jgi:hypothetical protein